MGMMMLSPLIIIAAVSKIIAVCSVLDGLGWLNDSTLAASLFAVYIVEQPMTPEVAGRPVSPGVVV